MYNGLKFKKITLHYITLHYIIYFPSMLWHCCLGDRTGIRPVIKLVVGLLAVIIWLELCTSELRLSSPLPSSLAPINPDWRHSVTGSKSTWINGR